MKLPLLIAATVGSALFALDASAQSTTTSTTSTGTAAPATSTTSTTTTAPASTVVTTPAATTTTSATDTAVVPPSTAPTTSTTTTSGVISAEGGTHAEDQPTTETSSPINRPLLVTGTVLLGGTYVASAIDAAESGRYADHHYLYYPVVGPWMDLGNRDCDSRPCNHETGNKVLLIADGVGQGLGALMMVTSLFIPEKTTKSWILLGNEKVQAGPTMVGTGYGLGAAGKF